MNDSIDSYIDFYNETSDSTTVISAYIMPEKLIQNFHFKKNQNRWYLNKVYIERIERSDNESFFDFIDSFIADTKFSKSRIAKGAKYITWEDTPENLVEYDIDSLTFYSSDLYLYKNIYVTNLNMESNNAIILIKGIYTSDYIESYFSRLDGKWYLTKYISLGV
jgi:hypothetical protein